MRDIVGGIGELLFGQLGRTPIRTLLLLRQIDVEQLLHQILQPVPVGIGAHQLGRDLGAVDRRRHHAEIAPEHRHIEARVVKQLRHLGIGQAGASDWAPHKPPAANCTICAVPSPEDKLRQAQPVAKRIEAERLAVDGNDGAEIEPIRQVVLMEFDFHVRIHNVA